VYLGRQQFAQCAVLFAQTQGLRIDRRLIIEIRIAVVLRSEWIGAWRSWSEKYRYKSVRRQL